MKRGRKGPADPSAIARRRALERMERADPSRWGVARGALGLEANRDVDADVGPAGHVIRARRQDVFDMMRARGRLTAGALDAVRRLQDDIACLHRTSMGGVTYTPRVDRSVDPQAFNDARRRAGARIENALARSGALSGRLLAALCEPEVVLGRAADWRAIVERETGESLPDAQGALLRMACENLAGAYGLTTAR